MALETLENKESKVLDVSSDKTKLSHTNEKTANKYLGGVWDWIVTNINPNNWGVVDLSFAKDFKNAFNTAKKAGLDEFLREGKRYLTRLKNLPGEAIKKRDDFTGNFLSKKANEVAGGKPNRDKFFGENFLLGFTGYGDKSIVNREDDYKEMYDLYRYYFGQTLKGNILYKSRYAPTNAKSNLNNYVAINDDGFINQILLAAEENNIELNKTISFNGYAKYNNIEGSTRIAPSEDKVGKPYEYKRPDGKIIKGIYGPTKKQMDNDFKKYYKTHALGNFRIGRGRDDRGEYVSYYDLFDIGRGTENSNTLGTAKSYEVYDRIYIKDYGNGKKKRMYYSDKELSELDVNKKNFDTLALQRELSNRGYKFPNSTKKDGTLDGVFGEETKQALLDRQKKNQKLK